MTENKLLELFPEAILNSKKDHYVASCPFCKKEGHFYINRRKIFRKTKGRYKTASDCKKCGETANLKKILKKLNSLHLLDGEAILFSSKLRKLNEVRAGEEEEEETMKVEKKKLPVGFKRKFNDEYLESRGWSDNEFGKYKVGRTSILSKLENYIIIAVEESGIIKGYLSRITLPKKEIQAIDKEYKRQGLKRKVLRYRNSKSDFSKLVFGLDEIMFNTEWVIIVEGLFDKTNVDIKLGLDNSARMKCVSTFGKTISKVQIKKLKMKGVKNVILIQDEDAIKVTRKHSETLSNEFDKVLLGYVKQPKGVEKDIGDCTKEEIEDILDNLMTPNIYRNKILRKL